MKAGTEPTFVPAPRPFKPRPVLLAGIAAVFAAWVGLMIWMYVTTVYPNRHASATEAPAAPRAEAR
jgi:hypothetical protein